MDLIRFFRKLMQTIIWFSCILFFLGVTSVVEAGLIIDTGPVADDGTGISIFYNTSKDYQYAAAKIVVEEKLTLGEVKTWMKICSAGPLVLKIYSNSVDPVWGDEMPDRELFSRSFAVDVKSSYHWASFQALNWFMAPGVYWLVLEPGEDFDASLSSGAINPLNSYAILNSMNNGWITDSTLSLGFQAYDASPSVLLTPIISLLL